MENLGYQPPRGENLGGVTRSIVLTPEQDAWLMDKRKQLHRSASIIVRDLIQEVMDREKANAPEESQPND